MPFLEVKCYMNHGCTVLGQSQPDSRHPAAHTKARKLLSKQREGMSACHRISSNKEKPQKDTKKNSCSKQNADFWVILVGPPKQPLVYVQRKL